MQEKKKIMPEGIFCCLKALLVSCLISAGLLLFLSFLLWKFSWEEKWVQAGIAGIYVCSCFFGGKIAGRAASRRRFFFGILYGMLYFTVLMLASVIFLRSDFAEPGRLLMSAALCAAGGMAGGITVRDS